MLFAFTRGCAVWVARKLARPQVSSVGVSKSLALSGFAWLCCTLAHAQPQAKPLDFAHEIVPLLKKHCVACHAGDNKKGGFSFNTRAQLLEGSENGPVVVAGKPEKSRMIEVVTSSDAGERMPPEGAALAASEVELLRAWIRQDLPWESGFAFKPEAYEPPLRPRVPQLPAPQLGRTNPVDRIIDQYTKDHQLELPPGVDDATFARRSSLDLIGLLPDVDKLAAFLADQRPDKRERWIDDLLADDMAYAEHWLTFWNDLLRNDYDGTGFITGGRKQISGWLYDSLIQNKPYDKFVRELIAPPSDDSRGFIDGIKWRGEVSAGQTVEIQFSQSISQSLLGINMKCASCHDSFIDRWKLDEAYGLAAIYATKPLEIARCDKPIGRVAQPAWLFPELGQIDSGASQPERLRQLADLMTHRDNGRVSRTLVNRLWHRMLGRGIVHPTDAMQTEPWNADLLDWLASDFAAQGYNIKRTLRLIATSAAYQSRCQVQTAEENPAEYVFAGQRAKRLTAEQFLDTLWQMTQTAPTKMDAKFLRGKLDPSQARAVTLSGQWIWSTDGSPLPAAGEKRTFRKQFELATAVDQSAACVTCDNQFTLYVDGKKLARGDNWQAPMAVALGPLNAGKHELLIVAENLGDAPNPAGLFFQARLGRDADSRTIASDSTWEWTDQVPRDNGKFAKAPSDWQPAVAIARADTWAAVNTELKNALARAAFVPDRMVRAALLKSNPLMRTLGRPNRDQIVSMRPNDLSTLEAIDLANGAQLGQILTSGAQQLLKRDWSGRDAVIEWIYRAALSRAPTNEEREVARQLLGESIDQRGLEDLLWSVIMLPEYQFVR